MHKDNTNPFLNVFFAAVAMLAISIPVLTQSGGTYAIQQSVIAGGGGPSIGGQYSVNGTAGQSVAGQRVVNGQRSVHAGFWNPDVIGPSAGLVVVSGQVKTPDGRGLRNAVVSITDSNGVKRTVTTSSFGFYKFDDVASGDTYVVGVLSKLYRFQPRLLPLTDSATDVDFVGLE